jgi:hypothetical protein
MDNPLGFHLILKGCDLYGFFGALFGFANITTLSVMSIERYIVVKSPLRRFNFFPKKFKFRKYFKISLLQGKIIAKLVFLKHFDHFYHFICITSRVT